MPVLPHAGERRHRSPGRARTRAPNDAPLSSIGVPRRRPRRTVPIAEQGKRSWRPAGGRTARRREAHAHQAHTATRRCQRVRTSPRTPAVCPGSSSVGRFPHHRPRRSPSPDRRRRGGEQGTPPGDARTGQALPEASLRARSRNRSPSDPMRSPMTCGRAVGRGVAGTVDPVDGPGVAGTVDPVDGPGLGTAAEGGPDAEPAATASSERPIAPTVPNVATMTNAAAASVRRQAGRPRATAIASGTTRRMRAAAFLWRGRRPAGNPARAAPTQPMSGPRHAQATPTMNSALATCPLGSTSRSNGRARMLRRANHSTANDTEARRPATINREVRSRVDEARRASKAMIGAAANRPYVLASRSQLTGLVPPSRATGSETARSATNSAELTTHGHSGDLWSDHRSRTDQDGRSDDRTADDEVEHFRQAGARVSSGG